MRNWRTTSFVHLRTVLLLTVLLLAPTALFPDTLVAQTTEEETDDAAVTFATQTFLPLITAPASTFLPMVMGVVDLYDPSPQDRATQESLNASLTWRTTSSFSDATYTIFLEANNANPDVPIAAGLVVAAFDPVTLEPDTQYYWRVVAVTSAGQRSESAVWTFRTEPVQTQPDLNAMVKVPGGSFLMGCDRTNPYEDTCSYNVYHFDEPVRTVIVDAFELDKFEVTNQEYRACMEAGACAAPRRRQEIDDPQFDLYPVVFVSWWDAQAFCAWEGKRLPTEAEWEKAARGAIDTRKWPWGNEAPDCSRVNANTIRYGICELLPKGVVPVGRYPRGASSYGAHDMSGNVFEWVSDKYDVWYYNFASNDNPQGPLFSRVLKTTGNPMVPMSEDELDFPVFSIRGGSWRDNPTYMRVSHRHWGHHGDTPNTDTPYFRNNKVGIRCAR